MTTTTAPLALHPLARRDALAGIDWDDMTDVETGPDLDDEPGRDYTAEYRAARRAARFATSEAAHTAAILRAQTISLAAWEDAGIHLDEPALRRTA